MSELKNSFGQNVGRKLNNWNKVPLPNKDRFLGKYCVLERISAAKHGHELYNAYSEAPDERDWTYLPLGPFDNEESYQSFLLENERMSDPLHYAVIDKISGKPAGTVALMRMDATNGVIEIGYVIYSPRMKRTRISTEVVAILLKYVFEELGYRRVEWKCDSLNAASRNAAERFGFKLEGVFRQAMVNRGRNRDTAWYSLIDSQYHNVRMSYERWLSSDNFDENGHQREKLKDIIERSHHD
ncbi:GNAT family N-acetyltransferase [Serratia marcescens]|uniref:GNAT family N-acetyltransferase n=1 Tax=Serratia marcescens TaxID=615 RepID=UPI003EE3AE2C